MLLSVHPDMLQKLRAEHDKVGGATFESGTAMLNNEPHRTAELEYTSAVIKETLRFFPVGFSVRQDDKE
jgi:cytochrome P450